jgi:uncharacterized membrane protein YgaE (UPF0421/DUF939 family)
LLIAQRLELEYPIYAMIAAVIVIDLSPQETRRLAWRRIAGTVLGSVLGGLLASFLPGGALVIGVGIFLAMLLSHVLRIPEAARVAGYLCAIVLLEHSSEHWIYAFWRLVETLLGIGVALVVSQLPRMIRTE